MARANSGFSENTPDRMRQIALVVGYEIIEEDLTTVWHSSRCGFSRGKHETWLGEFIALGVMRPVSGRQP